MLPDTENQYQKETMNTALTATESKVMQIWELAVSDPTPKSLKEIIH